MILKLFVRLFVGLTERRSGCAFACLKTEHEHFKAVLACQIVRDPNERLGLVSLSRILSSNNFFRIAKSTHMLTKSETKLEKTPFSNFGFEMSLQMISCTHLPSRRWKKFTKGVCVEKTS